MRVDAVEAHLLRAGGAAKINALFGFAQHCFSCGTRLQHELSRILALTRLRPMMMAVPDRGTNRYGSAVGCLGHRPIAYAAQHE